MSIAAWPNHESPIVLVTFHDDGMVSVDVYDELPLLFRFVAGVTAFQALMYEQN